MSVVFPFPPISIESSVINEHAEATELEDPLNPKAVLKAVIIYSPVSKCSDSRYSTISYFKRIAFRNNVIHFSQGIPTPELFPYSLWE